MPKVTQTGHFGSGKHRLGVTLGGYTVIKDTVIKPRWVSALSYPQISVSACRNYNATTAFSR